MECLSSFCLAGELSVLRGGLTRWMATYLSRLPDEVWLHAQVALGLGLVLFGLSCRTHAEVRAVRNSPSGLFGPFLFGPLLILNEVTTAVPCFAAIALMSEASLTPSECQPFTHRSRPRQWQARQCRWRGPWSRRQKSGPLLPSCRAV